VSGPFGGGVFIADTSAWARVDRSSVRRRFGAALRNGQIVTCAIVSLELLHSARNGAELDERMGLLAHSTTSPSDAR
jgi:predicted nucleic acid-binding protein